MFHSNNTVTGAILKRNQAYERNAANRQRSSKKKVFKIRLHTEKKKNAFGIEIHKSTIPRHSLNISRTFYSHWNKYNAPLFSWLDLMKYKPKSNYSPDALYALVSINLIKSQMKTYCPAAYQRFHLIIATLNCNEPLPIC